MHTDDSGNKDKYDHLTFNIPSRREISSLTIQPTTNMNGNTLYYRIQNGTAVDLTASDLVSGTFTVTDVTNSANVLTGGIILNGYDLGKDYAMLIYNDADSSNPIHYKISGISEKEPAPEPEPEPESEPEPEPEPEPPEPEPEPEPEQDIQQIEIFSNFVVGPQSSSTSSVPTPLNAANIVGTPTETEITYTDSGITYSVTIPTLYTNDATFFEPDTNLDPRYTFDGNINTFITDWGSSDHKAYYSGNPTGSQNYAGTKNYIHIETSTEFIATKLKWYAYRHFNYPATNTDKDFSFCGNSTNKEILIFGSNSYTLSNIIGVTMIDLRPAAGWSYVDTVTNSDTTVYNQYKTRDITNSTSYKHYVLYLGGAAGIMADFHLEGTFNHTTATFTSGETYTINTFIDKLSNTFDISFAYHEPYNENVTNSSNPPYLELLSDADLSGLPSTIFNLNTSSQNPLSVGDKLYFNYINVEDTITIADTTNTKNFVVSPGDYFVHDFIHKLETDLEQSLSYDGTNIIFEDISGATSIDITITTNDTSIFGISSKTLTSGDNTLPFITYGQPEPDPIVYNWASSYTQQMVKASNASNDDLLGETVSISGNYAIVGTKYQATVVMIVEQLIFMNAILMVHGTKFQQFSKQAMLEKVTPSVLRSPLAVITLSSVLRMKTVMLLVLIKQLLVIQEQRIFLNVTLMVHGMKLKCSKQVIQ